MVLFLPWGKLNEDCLNPSVADPGPLMPGVLDRWTPTVNV